MKYAEVAVDVPLSVGQSFTYAIPVRLHNLIHPGQLVYIPFQTRQIIGIVVEVKRVTDFENPREVLGIAVKTPFLSSSQLQLAFWISGYYHTSLFRALAFFSPPGYVFRNYRHVRLREELKCQLTQNHSAIVEALRGKGWVAMGRLAMTYRDPSEFSDVINELKIAGILDVADKVLDIRIHPKLADYISISYKGKRYLNSASVELSKVPRQFQLLQELASMSHPIAKSQLTTQYSRGIISQLESKGYLYSQKLRQNRMPDIEIYDASLEVQPHKELSQLINDVQLLLSKKENFPQPVLLKTKSEDDNRQVYIDLIDHCLNRGKKALIIMPENLLADQLASHFNSRFPGKIGIFHSGLSLGQQYDQWVRIQKGEFDVVIGSRSALFAPIGNIGLVILDAEHDWSHKQQEVAPRYHAKKIALKLAQLNKALFVMGSITPSVETYHQCLRGQVQLLTPKILTADETTRSTVLQRTEVIDMRLERGRRDSGIFSATLKNALAECLLRGEQAALLINRRGNATMVYCRRCGYICKCIRCNIPLKYLSADLLQCSLCHSTYPTPKSCPSCSSRSISTLGIGTERVADEVAAMFPAARVTKWDKDTAPNTKTHKSILQKLINRKTDILVGTQMILKGLNIPTITLVGVINTDIGLQSTDFRSPERTFQLLAGIPRNSDDLGKNTAVVIQTYQPSNHAILAGARNDYDFFYQTEISSRKKFQLPPFTNIIKISLANSDPYAAETKIRALSDSLSSNARKYAYISSIVGPVPEYPYGVQGIYRWHILLVGQNPGGFLRLCNIGPNWIIDVDPMSVF